MNILFLLLWILVPKSDSTITSTVHNGNFQYISESTNTGGNTKEVTLITAKTCPCEGHQKEIVENYKSNKDSLGRNKLSLSAQRVVLDYKIYTKKAVRKKKYMRCEKNKTQDYLHNEKIPNFKTFPVLCIDGWTIIQQRINGKENFTRNWEDYKNGFGVFTGDFFLGLEKIHRLTNDQPHELIIHLEKFNGTNYYARYKNFKIAGEDDKYKLLSLGSFSGNSTWDGMKKLPGTQFSTIDSDNDAWMEGNCAKERQAGWWFRKCALSNPNGVYHQEETYEETSDWWNMYYSLKTIHMAIRQKK